VSITDVKKKKAGSTARGVWWQGEKVEKGCGWESRDSQGSLSGQQKQHGNSGGIQKEPKEKSKGHGKGD